MSGVQLPKWIATVLSREQQQPIIPPTPNACVLAGAGSGKTRTLVHMLLSDLERGVSPEGIVAFTFTEKAADELLSRIHSIAAQYLPNVDLAGLFVGTIHSWCLRYLLDQNQYYGFTPLDELQVDALASRLYDYLDIATSYGKPYPKGIKKFLADLEVFYNEGLDLESVPLQIRESIGRFLGVLEGNHLLTFGSMVNNARVHLERAGGSPDIEVVYIDEYQDVNPAQVLLAKAMLRKGGRIVAVGDDLQCIYNWRGSDVKRILSFDTDFSQSMTFRLSANYRSRPGIVKVANAVADKLSLRDRKKVMLSQRPESTCNPVEWLSVSSEKEQADTIVKIVTRLMAEGVPPNSIAVLLRSVRGSGRPIVDALEAAGIPVVCPVLSRAAGFICGFILPVLDWLRREHPEPKNEVEEEEAEILAQALWDTVSPWVIAIGGETTFWGALNNWLDSIDAKSAAAYDLRGRLYDFLESCGVCVSRNDSDLMIGLGISSQIVRSVEEIHRRRIAGQMRRTPRGLVSEAFYSILRNYEDFGESIPIEKVGYGVCVSTIHQAKGLEWPVVIVPMLRDRKFPVRPSSHGTSYPDEIAARYGTSLDDERRLFYVALSRAKERLFFIDPELGNHNRRSVFLAELGATGLQPIDALDQVSESTWVISAEDLKEPDQPPLRIALSDVLLYLGCPYRYALSRVVNIEPAVGDELGYGKSLHELIQRRLEATAPWNDAQLDAAAKDHVSLPYMSEDGEAKARRTIRNYVKELCDVGLLDSDVESEISVECVLEGGIIHGTTDAIHLRPDGSTYVRDWKSTIHEGFHRRYDAQLKFYVAALRKSGRSVDGAELINVKETVNSHEIAKIVIDVSPDAIETQMHELQAVLYSMRDNDYPPTPSAEVCQACDMRRICGERKN